MNEQKTVNTRFKQKIDTTANWNSATSFIPLKGELIVYSDAKENCAKFKIGDGVTTVVNLPFAYNDAVEANTAITSGTKCKVTYDSKGLVTGGDDLAASDIPELSTSKITGLDTTLADKMKKVDVGNEGDFMRVVSGEWKSVPVANAEDNNF